MTKTTYRGIDGIEREMPVRVCQHCGVEYQCLFSNRAVGCGKCEVGGKKLAASQALEQKIRGELGDQCESGCGCPDCEGEE